LASARVCTYKVGLENGVIPIHQAEFFNASPPDFRIVQQHVTGAEYDTALAHFVLSPQTSGQKPQCASRALIFRQGGPPLTHQVEQGRVEWISQPHSVPQLDALFGSLLFLCSIRRVGLSHLREDLLERRRCGASNSVIGHLLQQASLNDLENFVLFNRLSQCVLPAYKMVQRLEKLAML
jgi:hypothetical protein